MDNSRKKSILIGYMAVGMNAVSTLILTNMYIRYIGIDAYGLYQMINAMAQYILLFDFGIATTVTRFRITVLDGKKEADENLLAHCMAIIVCLVLAVLAVGSIITLYIGDIYPSLSPKEVELARQMMIIIILQMSMVLIQHFFSGIILSEEKYSFVKGMELFSISCKFVLIIILLPIVKNVLLIVCVDCISSLLVLATTVIYAYKNVTYKVKLHYVDRKLLKAIFALMGALLLQSIATYINNVSGKTILGIVLDKEAVAIYSFAITINAFFAAIPNTMNSVYVPKATQLVMRKANGEELTDLVIAPGRVQFMFCGAVVMGYLLFGKYFMKLWVDVGTEDAWLCAVILIVPHLFPLVQNVCLSILTALNKRLVRSLIVIGTSVINIIVTILLVKRVGVLGAAIGTAVSVVIGNIIITNIYYRKVIHLNVIRMYKEIFKGTFSCIIIASIASIPTLLIKCTEIWHLIIGGVVFVIVYFVLMCIYGFNKEERETLVKICNRVRKRD